MTEMFFCPKSQEIIHTYLKSIAILKLAGYAAWRFFIQLRMPATIEPTIKNVAIA
jgi:hypothetical protein